MNQIINAAFTSAPTITCSFLKGLDVENMSVLNTFYIF